MDIPHLATILSSTFDPNLREEAERKLNEVSVEDFCLFRKGFTQHTFHTIRPIFGRDFYFVFVS